MAETKSSSKPTTASWSISHKEMTSKALKLSIKANREYILAKDEYSATHIDNYLAVALAVRERVVERWIETQQRYHKSNAKRVYYLSMEFLIGRLFGNYLFNLGLENECQKATEEMGMDITKLREQELDAGLGNGGLGRLAACFLDSMASLGIPAHGYGIRFDYGIFHQKIRDGWQVELPDEWLRQESPWEFARPEYAVNVKFGGHVEVEQTNGRPKFYWKSSQDVMAVPFDFPIPGYKNDIVNTLRLWSAHSTANFDLEYFQHGDYERAVAQKVASETISKVLYPADDKSCGKELRLKQEYFLTAAAIADIIRRFKVENTDLRQLPEKAVIQLNDTHPCMAIPELMRVLLDEYSLEWDEAWDVTRRVFAYTNHTLMPEALETWGVDLFERLLPRHLQIIFEINNRFLNEILTRFPNDTGRLARMSIIEEGFPKRVRMAYLAIVGSFSVNGVSQLHSDLLKTHLLHDFYELYPEKFNNKTNGITARRWLLKANQPLSKLITEAIGDQWPQDLDQLSKLMPLKDNNAFCQKWRQVKHANKLSLAAYIEKSNNIIINPESIFDVQVKRMHEYKRQLLFAFFMIHQYLRIKHNPSGSIIPRTFIIGGKAAPSYWMAKLIIKFINNIGQVINNDASIKDKIKVVFMENYRVSLAERIFPASDLSEQISTAGTEASGTGNMKFMINGALTIGTYDGANIEIAQRVGDENIFIFGLKAHEVEALKRNGYSSRSFIERHAPLAEILHLISSNFFSPHQPGLFDPIVQSMYEADPFLVCADFEAYTIAQQVVEKAYKDKTAWTKKSIHNVACAGFFSSDRTIKEYAKDIWKV